MDHLPSLSRNVSNYYLCNPEVEVVVVDDDDVQPVSTDSLNPVYEKIRFEHDYASREFSNATAQLSSLTTPNKFSIQHHQKTPSTRMNPKNFSGLSLGAASNSPPNLANSLQDARNSTTYRTNPAPLNTLHNSQMKNLIKPYQNRPNNLGIANNYAQPKRASQNVTDTTHQAKRPSVIASNNYLQFNLEKHSKLDSNYESRAFSLHAELSTVAGNTQPNSQGNFTTIVKNPAQPRMKPNVVNCPVVSHNALQRAQSSDNTQQQQVHKGTKAPSIFAKVSESRNLPKSLSSTAKVASANVAGPEPNAPLSRHDFHEVNQAINALKQIDWSCVLKNRDETLALLSSFENGICSYYPGFVSVVGPEYDEQPFDEYFDDIIGLGTKRVTG